MNQLPPVPASFQEKLDKMWQAACRVCDNILDFQPNLVLALMHSGWGPVFAAQALWQARRSEPFPPLARVNLGREKGKFFDKEACRLGGGLFMGTWSFDVDVGHFLAWLTTRHEWQVELRQLITEAMPTGAAPQRILVVDECIHEGSTYLMTFSLLDLVFPQAVVRFLDAGGWYHSEYGELMLATVCPPADVFPEGKLPDGKLRIDLERVAMGSEDTSPDSLSWQAISPASPAVQALSAFRPAEEWLAMSQAVYAILASYIQGRAVDYNPAEPEAQTICNDLLPQWRLMRDIWLEHGITRRQAEQRSGLPPKSIDRILVNWIYTDQVMLTGRGRGAHFVIPPPIQDHLSYRHIEYPSAPLDLLWLQPDRLAFGEGHMDFHDQELGGYAQELINHLLDLGVDCWIDVQTISKGFTVEENHAFAELAQARQRSVEMHLVVLETLSYDAQNSFMPKRGRPNRRDIRPILDQIDHSLAAGRVVFVCCDERELRGILAGCYLARHGQAGSTALKALQACRAATVCNWRRDPVSERARRYVRRWPAGT